MELEVKCPNLTFPKSLTPKDNVNEVPREIVRFKHELRTQEWDVKMIQLDLQSQMKNPTATPPKNL